MKSALAILFSMLTTAAYAVDCGNKVVFDDGENFGQVFISLNTACEQKITVNQGDAITITSNGKRADMTATAARPVLGDTLRITAVVAGPAAADAATLEQFAPGDATVTANGDSVPAKIIIPGKPAVNIARYDWSIGPAMKESKTDDTAPAAAATDGAPSDDANAALRFRYDGEYARPGFLGRTAASSNFQTAATLSIDTTNSNDTAYIDNNRLTFGVQYSKIPSTRLLAQVKGGFEGRLTKALHADAHDADAVATFSTWVPAIPSITILGSGANFIAPPLTIDLSYGYRNKRVAGDNVHGRVGQAVATYYLFAMERYQLGLTATWTLNDLSGRPAAIPRTQRLYKATISYLQNPAKGFSVLTSYEDGSIGPLATKVKQYFIGMALMKFSPPGASKP